MQAICVKPDRTLEVRDVEAPTSPPAGHLLVEIEACAINHGDKTFLTRSPPMTLAPRGNDGWGASAVGRVVAVGKGAPQIYAGRQVAVYRSLRPTTDTIGLWCERAQVHHLCCLILPDEVEARDYCGSLVNAVTAYAFLAQAHGEGHEGIIVTAGNSATGRAISALARRRDVPLIRLVRSPAARLALASSPDVVLDTSADDFDEAFTAVAQRLRATAVFDGLGGAIVGRLAPNLPENATLYAYGFLDGATPISIPTTLLMTKNLVLRRFSNFSSATVTDQSALSRALAELHETFDDAFRTTIGKHFRFGDIAAAMRFEDAAGAKAVLVA